MKIKELHEAIRQQTMAINERLVEYYEKGAPDKLVNKEIEYLKKITGTSQKSSYISMRTHRKNKMELELQLNELRYFENWDIFTPGGQTERSKASQRAYQSFKRNAHRYISYEDYRRVVNVMGTAGREVMNLFGGDSDTREIVETAIRKGKSGGEILKAMQEVINNNKKVSEENNGSLKSTQDYADDLRALLNLET